MNRQTDRQRKEKGKTEMYRHGEIKKRKKEMDSDREKDIEKERQIDIERREKRCTER